MDLSRIWFGAVVLVAAVFAYPDQTSAQGAAGGDALCGLISKHFTALIPANPQRGFVNADTCEMGGADPGKPPAGRVKVNVNPSTGLTGPGLAKMYANDKQAHAVDGIGDGAIEKEITGLFPRLVYGVAKGGRLILIDIDLPKAPTADDRTRAQAAVRALVAAL